MALLSVDIGTGGTRAVLFNGTGGIIASAYQEYSFTSPRPGWAELDAETIAVGDRLCPKCENKKR